MKQFYPSLVHEAVNVLVQRDRVHEALCWLRREKGIVGVDLRNSFADDAVLLTIPENTMWVMSGEDQAEFVLRFC